MSNILLHPNTQTPKHLIEPHIKSACDEGSALQSRKCNNSVHNSSNCCCPPNKPEGRLFSMKILHTLCCTLLLVLSLSRTGVASASTLIATAPAITAYSQQVVARHHNRLYVPAAIPAVPVYPAYATTAYATYPTTAYGYPRYGYGYGYYPTYGYGYSYASVPTTALWR